MDDIEAPRAVIAEFMSNLEGEAQAHHRRRPEIHGRSRLQASQASRATQVHLQAQARAAQVMRLLLPRKFSA